MKNRHLHSKKALRAALLVLLLSVAGMTKANPVDMRTAREVGFRFMNANAKVQMQGIDDMHLVTTYNISRGDVAFYVFNTPNGFVIVSADDCVTPILGYSDEGQFDTDNIPIQLQDYLQSFVEQIQYGIENHIEAKENVVSEWELVRTIGRLSNNRSDEVVEPLLTTKWDQRYPYNMYVPSGYPTGCTATAMAQVMKYWEWPVQGTGEHSYQWNGQTLSANFGETTYDWDNMLDYHSYQSTQEQNEAVATLMWHCGVSVNMNYAAGGSGAFLYPSSLIDYFNYSDDMHSEQRQNLDDESWMSLLKTDLNLGYPVFYVGYGSFLGGHAFVCDGYDVNDRFHFNWGWSGSSNGYFALNGIDFYDDNSAIFNIHPNASITRQVTASASPSDGGLVTGTGMYAIGSICTLTATANEGYAFMYWTEDDEVVSTQAEYSFCVRKDRELVAHFGTPFHIGVTIVPEEGGTVSGEGEYAYGSTCTLTATANEGYDFICWRKPNGNVVTTAPTCSFTVTEATTLTAVFAVSGGEQIPFADLNVKALCVANWDTNGDGELSYAEAAAVTDLGQVFRNNRTITSFEELQYFTGLTTIGNDAFSSCRNLSGTLNIPNSVTSIGDNAFQYCISFTNGLTIPDSVTSIGDDAFYGCSGFTGSLILGNSVTTIGSWAFYDCIGFTGSLIIPNSVTTIGYDAFRNCTGFTGSLTIGNSVTEIGGSAFENCTGFTGSLTIPNSVTTIGWLAFRNCTGFTGSLTIGNSVTEIDMQAFNNCIGFTGSLTIPNSVTTIGLSAFENCRGFTGDLNIPNSVTKIYDYAFYNCSGFTGNLTIGDSVAVINWSTFSGCSGFTGNLTIGNSVTTIGSGAFFLCENFSSLTILAEIPPTLGSQVFAGVYWEIPVYVPCESAGAYMTANWGGFNDFYGMCGGTVAVSANPEEGGTVAGGGVFEAGESCMVTATANEGYSFAYWDENGEQVSSEANYSFVVVSNRDLVAHFSLPLTVSVTTNMVGGGTVTGGGIFNYGTTCTLTATPNPGYVFNNWTKNGEVVSCLSTCQIPVTETAEYVANFQQVDGIVVGDAVSSSYYLPTYFTNSLTEQIYTASEMGGMATDISSVSFFNTGSSKSLNMSIYMVNTDKTSFGSNTDWISVTDANLVFSGSVTFATNNWTTIYFNTPFVYDGVSNVALIVDGNSNSYNSYTSFRTFNTEVNQALRINSSTNYDPYVPNSYTGTLMSEKNQVVFGIPNYEFTVSVSANPTYGGTVSGGGGLYFYGQPVPLIATPAEGYVFNNWTKNGEAVSYFSTAQVSVTESAEYVANFQQVDGIVIGDASSSNYYLPTYYCNSLTEQIYTASEMGGMATDISSVSFFNTGSSSRTRTMSVYMVSTEKTVFDSVSDWIPITESDLVYSGNVVIPAHDWATIYFSMPFNYDGLSNVALIVDDNSNNYNTSTSCRTFNTEENQAIRVYGYYDIDYDPTNPSYYTGTLMSEKNQVVFGIPNYEYTLTVAANPEEGGTVGGANGSLYFYGQPVNLTATPNEGYFFMNWTENGIVVSYDATYSFTITGDRNLVANFAEEGSMCFLAFDLYDSFGDGWTDNYLVIDYGDGNSEQLTISSGSSASYSLIVATGSHVTLTWIMGDWTDDCSFDIRFENGILIYHGSNLNASFQYEFTLDCSAAFAPSVISAIAEPEEGGTIEGAGTYDGGTTCTLVATPNESYFFMNWMENGIVVSYDATYSFTVTSDRNLVANFAEEGSMCFLVFDLYDSFGDGWTDNYLVIDYGNGNSEQLTIEDDSSASYPRIVATGSHVTLTWIEGYWTEECSFDIKYENGITIYHGSNLSSSFQYEFTLDCSAAFAPSIISAIAEPEEGGTIEGAGIYDGGTTCTLVATPNEGYFFMNWMENGIVVSYDTTYSFTVTGDRNLVANFAEEGSCFLVFDLYDSYGDGWTDNYLVIDYGNGNSEQLTIDDWGWSASYSRMVATGSHVTLTWIEGYYPEDCSFTVHYEDGDTIYEGSNIGSNFEYSFDVDCSGGNVTQTITLSQGSNYCSFNVGITLDDLKDALVAAFPNSAISIKSKTQTHSYNPVNQRWTGAFDTFDLGRMNIIKVDVDGEITLQGLPVDPADHSVTITEGSNYLAFPLSESMTPADAFAGFAVQGDKIKSKTATAVYNRGQWGNQIPVLEPGQGYIYISNSQGTRIFTFPASAK